jgi:hypothetical protein
MAFVPDFRKLIACLEQINRSVEGSDGCDLYIKVVF